MKTIDVIREGLARDVKISVGFGEGFSLQHGLVLGPYDMTVSTDHGAIGTVIPVMGDRHIKMFLGSD